MTVCKKRERSLHFWSSKHTYRNKKLAGLNSKAPLPGVRDVGNPRSCIFWSLNRIISKPVIKSWVPPSPVELSQYTHVLIKISSGICLSRRGELEPVGLPTWIPWNNEATVSLSFTSHPDKRGACQWGNSFIAWFIINSWGPTLVGSSACVAYFLTNAYLILCID